MEFELKIKSPSDALSLGSPFAVAHLHLIDPETWRAYRKAQQGWSAYLPQINHWDHDQTRYSQPARGTTPAGGPKARIDASEALVLCEGKALISFCDRLLSGALLGFGRTDQQRFNSWEWIDPLAWKVLRSHRAPGTYNLDGQIRFVDVHFRDTEGVPDDQAAWAYASPELLAELTKYEQWGGACVDQPPWQQLPRDRAPVDLSYRAEARLSWHRLIAQAAAELEEKIDAGRLERVNGLIRPASPRSANPDTGQQREAGPVSASTEPDSPGQTAGVSAKNKPPLREIIEFMLHEQRSEDLGITEKNFRERVFSKWKPSEYPGLTSNFFHERVLPKYKQKAGDENLPIGGVGRPRKRPPTRN